MYWVPPFLVLLLFGARLVELRHRFKAEPGRVVQGWTFMALTLAGGLTIVGAVVEYFVRDRGPSWALVAVGVLMGAAAFALRAASRRALDRMWSVHIEIRDQHALVQHGPYRFVRHPIYVAMMLEVAAAVVVLGSWWTGIPGVLLSALAVAARVRAEEAAMARQLGDAWTAYCRRTPAFFPLW